MVTDLTNTESIAEKSVTLEDYGKAGPESYPELQRMLGEKFNAFVAEEFCDELQTVSEREKDFFERQTEVTGVRAAFARVSRGLASFVGQFTSEPPEHVKMIDRASRAVDHSESADNQAPYKVREASFIWHHVANSIDSARGRNKKEAARLVEAFNRGADALQKLTHFSAGTQRNALSDSERMHVFHQLCRLTAFTRSEAEDLAAGH